MRKVDGSAIRRYGLPIKVIIVHITINQVQIDLPHSTIQIQSLLLQEILLFGKSTSNLV
jgi:hypothetical protein